VGLKKAGCKLQRPGLYAEARTVPPKDDLAHQLMGDALKDEVADDEFRNDLDGAWGATSTFLNCAEQVMRQVDHDNVAAQ
jgi:hypothetical protein